MKKLFYLTLILLFGLNTFSQTNEVVIYSEQGEKFYMYVNGVKQNETPQSNVRGKNITSENFQVRVSFEDSSIPDITQNFWTESKDVEITAVVREGRRGSYSIRYRGETPIARDQTRASESESVATYEYPSSSQSQPASQSQTQSSSSVQTGSGADSFGMNVGVSDSGMSMQVGVGDESFNMNVGVTEGASGQAAGSGHASVNVNVNESSHSSQHTSSSQTVSSSTSVSGSGFMPNGSMCTSPTMDQKKYMDFRYAIEAENMFRRQEFILNTIKENCMLAVQIAGIIKQNYSTVTELDIAKQAYRSTFDTENYGVVVEALRHDREKKELLTFLSAGSMDMSVDFSYTETTSGHQQDVTQTQTEPNHYKMPGYSGRIGCPWPMEQNEFNNAKQSISNRSFEDDKLRVARQITSNNCLTTDQIVAVMNLFSFEESKLEFAKFAYDYVYDIGNYYKLNDAFSFSSSIEELDDYIMSR